MAPSTSGALRGTGTSVTPGPRNGASARAFRCLRCGSALSMALILPALIAPQILLDDCEISAVPRGEKLASVA